MHKIRNTEKRILARLLAVILISGIVGIGSNLFGTSPGGEVHAVSMGTNIKQGDTIVLQAGEWNRDYLVLDPQSTNTDQTGVFLLQKNYISAQGSVPFDPNGTSNAWQGSNVQAKCADYYTSMPDSLKTRVIGVKKTEPSSTIDGTRTGEQESLDKTFLLSLAEFLKYKDYISKSGNWWLRTPDTTDQTKAYYIKSTYTASTTPYDKKPVNEEWMVLRPAFNIDLPQEFCASSKELQDGTTEWTVDLDNLDHAYCNPTYAWSDSSIKCTARSVCDICGKTIKETVYTTSDLLIDGSTVYTASFSNTAFKTQTKTIRANSLTGMMRPGDLLRVKDGSKSTDYIVLDPVNSSVGTDGMFVLLKDSTEKTAFDATQQSNDWEGSTAQEWCTNYYRNLPKVIKDAVVGVQTHDTESGQDWLGPNNIDGTKSDKDKVFFLSYKEYLRHKNLPNMRANYKWLVRDYGMDCATDIRAYVGVIQENGEPKDYGIHSLFAARPAFNLMLSDNIYASKSTSGGISIWTLDVNNPYGESTTPVVKTVVKVDKKLPGISKVKLSRGKKSLVTKWKKLKTKDRKKIQGIEVQYAANKSFKDATVKTVKKTGKSVKIKKLRTKKTYWVRVRTYKKTGNTIYVSRWSKAKKVKVK